MELLKEIGVSVDNIKFAVRHLSDEQREHAGSGYYTHVDPVVDYTIYLPTSRLNGQCAIPYDAYKDMKHFDVAEYIKNKFIEDL